MTDRGSQDSQGSHGGFDHVLYEVDAGIAWVKINRPEKLNALNQATVRELVRATELALSDTNVKVIVLRGVGEKAFVAGADIGEMAELNARDGEAHAHFLQRSLHSIERSTKPVIAAINGFALGGGCELAMACHLRVAVEQAKFGQPEVNLGLIPGAGGTQRLQRLVGRGRAVDLILTGRMVDANEALRIGLVDRVVAADGLDESVRELAALLMTKSPLAQTRALEAIYSGGEVGQNEALRFEAALFGLCFASADMQEGTRAFVEKRKPDFPGR